MDEDRSLFAWFRHYAAVILFLTALGAVGGWIYTKAVPPRQEAWTIVLETGEAIGPLQLGAVAQAVFNSANTYAPVLNAYRRGESPQRVLGRDVQLLPIPGSNAMIVIGRGRSFDQAALLSSAMAKSMVQTFASKGFPKFTTFAPQHPTGSTHASVATVVMIGAAVGLWLGVGAVVLHYRARRPVLALARAVSVADPQRVVVLPRRGALRRGRRSEWRDNPEARLSLGRMAVGHGGGAVPEIVAPGTTARTQRRLSKRLRAALAIDRPRGPGDPGWIVFVCTPSTGEFDLSVARRISQPDATAVDLIWVR